MMDNVLLAVCLAGLGLTISLSLFTLGGSKMTEYIPKSHQKSKKTVKAKRRVLIVTAHPDDECMFFGPSILHFTQKEKALVYLLCLSPGNFYAEGNQREFELWSSCKLLGIPPENIFLYKCEDLPDNPSVMWPTHHTSQIICHSIHTLDIDMVITFDARGVSGHVNHCAINNALEYLIEEEEIPPDCEAFYLHSVNILRKYSSILDVFFSFLFSSYVFTTNYNQLSIIQKAMRAHASQYVWFRRLYIMFSRYVLINTLHKAK